jgi:hypothetical protein
VWGSALPAAEVSTARDAVSAITVILNDRNAYRWGRGVSFRLLMPTFGIISKEKAASHRASFGAHKTVSLTLAVLIGLFGLTALRVNLPQIV